MKARELVNPYRPGAGHTPPYLAGREPEKREFERLLKQTTILQNLVLTGLRGVGKTVLLEQFKPAAVASGWLWVGTDLSESTSVSEINVAVRLLADLSVVTSSMIVQTGERRKPGLPLETEPITRALDFHALQDIYNRTPGLASDKLKTVLEMTWNALKQTGKRGVVFAYDEAQNLADHAARNEYPLSLILDVFQSLQRKGVPFMLALTGLPTLFPRLVGARTYAERMFHILSLGPLSDTATREAVLKPIAEAKCPVKFSETSVIAIAKESAGYPFFIQYFCRECFDIWAANHASGQEFASIPMAEILKKLDTDFFSGRWSRATDRQRELLWVIATLDNSDREFSVQDIVERSLVVLKKGFSASHANQILEKLTAAELVYKNRRGRYLLAVPLLDQFIRRAWKDEWQDEEEERP